LQATTQPQAQHVVGLCAAPGPSFCGWVWSDPSEGFDKPIQDANAQKETTTNQESTPYVRQYNLRSNTQDKSKTTALPSPQGPTASSGAYTSTFATSLNLQLPKPVFAFQSGNPTQITFTRPKSAAKEMNKSTFDTNIMPRASPYGPW
jgi:hypothetical protein